MCVSDNTCCCVVITAVIMWYLCLCGLKYMSLAVMCMQWGQHPQV